MKTLPLLLSILCFISCIKTDPTNSTLDSSAKIILSEVPVIIATDCLAKTVFTRLDNFDVNAKVELEVLLDGEYLYSEVNQDPQKVKNIELPEDISAKNVTINYKNEGILLASATYPIQYIDVGETVEFTSYNLGFKPIHILENACWPDYQGSFIPRSENYKLHAEELKETRVEGDQISHIIELKNVRLEDLDSGKSIKINPDLKYEYQAYNYLSLTNIKASTSLSEQTIFNQHDDMAVKMKISMHMSTDGQSKPSYLVQAYEYGQHIKARKISCSTYDTLSVEKIIIPKAFQVNVQCK